MKCARTQDLFSSHLENAMEPPLRAAFEQHLAECPECKARYEKFNVAILMMEEMQELDVPEGFHSAVMARVEQSRRVVPQPVRWWSLDWQRVFTVRVPARALAMGLSAALLVALLVQFTPLHSITANLITPSRQTGQGIGPNDPGTEKLPVKHWDVNGSSMSIIVDASAVSSAQNIYSLQFKSKSSEAIRFYVFRMPADAKSAEAGNSPFYSGYVESKQDAVVSVDAGTTVRIDWKQDGRAYREYVFMPSQLSSVAASKNLPVIDASIYGALKQVSELYGVVVIASGDLSKNVSLAAGASQRPEDALYDIARVAGLKCEGVALSIYKVQPGI
ncbi:MAG: zf-HC2 domain-containing protein [Armatimonadetes bacterium]|nr:zf-HC2 domain-containing protein [Armatimonadota bacterium]